MRDNEFFMLKLIEDSNISLIKSDKKNYIIGRNDKKLPTWIWTKNNISKEKIKELLIDLDNYLTKEWNIFTTKKELYDILKEIYQTKDYIELAYLECKELKEIDLSTGFMDKVSISDKNIIIDYWKEYWQQLFPTKKFTEQDYNDEVDKLLRSNNFYVWRNNKGKVVCTVSYIILNDKVLINNVYTAPEERRKGYCKSLIYQLTKILLNNHLKPILYTDNYNIASNKVYKSIGYKKKKVLINFRMRKNKK